MTVTHLDSPAPTRDLWEGVWEKSTVPRHAHAHLLAACEKVLPMPDARILEVGCGSAMDSLTMAQRGAQAFSMDYSLHALRHARQYAEKAQVTGRFSAGDIFNLPYAGGSFDLVFSQGLMEHFTDPLPALKEQVRVIRSGGYLCVDVPQTWSLLTLYKRWHIRRGTWFAGWETDYSLPKLQNLMRAAGLDIVTGYGWMYFPSLMYGLRNLHTLDERYRLPVWLTAGMKSGVENGWSWLEAQPWYYRWLGCIGVIGRKP